MTRGRQWLLASVVFAGSALCAAAHAQQGPNAQAQPQGSGVSEVVVTAEKRTERLMDVPQSVSVVSGQQLQQMQATSMLDWAGYVPGLTVAQVGAPGLSFIALDGIPPIGAASEVGVYVNETPIGSSSSFQGANGFSMDMLPYDLDRAEVLRGPQGTLYGASTMGGLIKYVLTAPDLNSFSGHIGGDVFAVERANQPGGGGRGEVNVPIIDGKLAVRVSAYDENTPGFIDDATTGQKDDNPVRQQGGRVAIRWQPVEDFNAQFDAIYQNTHADNLSIVALSQTTGQPLFGNLSNINTLPEPYTQALQLYSMTLNWNLHWAQLTSITSYQTFTNQATEDLTDYIGKYLGFFGAPGPGLSDFHEDYRLKKWTQEVRLASPEGQKFEWMVGGFYTHEDGSNYEVFNAYDTTGAPLPGLNPLEFVNLPSTYQEYAFFGHATYHFTDWFDLTAGVRYAHNNQTFTQFQGGVLVGSSPPTAPVVTVPGSSSEGVTTFSVDPRFHINKDTIAYVRIASGYQPGGPNVVLPGVTGIPSQFSSSRLIDYQLGLKSTFLDGQATADLSAFYINWSKIQVGVLIGNESAIENAGSARSEGFDFHGTYSPIRGLVFGAGLTYTDAFLTSAVPSIGAANGARLPYIPLWAGSLTVDYSQPVGDGWAGFVGGGWTYSGSRYSAVQGSIANGEIQGLEVGAYGDMDIHAGVRSHDMTISLFAKNALDSRAFLAPATYFYDALTLPIDIKAPVLQPRTIGLSIDKSF
ncbi:MAG TPA: TonB-dependent receptor [Caulobacteraceae bacterium]|jgi:outer membrane receptor protein involved in Fe transport